MSEQIKEAGAETLTLVNSFLKEILTDAVKLKNFAVEQLPDVVQQFLQWKLYEHLLQVVIPLVLFILCVSFFIKGLRYGTEIVDGEYGKKSRFFYDDQKAIWLEVSSGLGSIVFLILTLACFNLKWLQILVAPKVYLLEYAASFLK